MLCTHIFYSYICFISYSFFTELVYRSESLTKSGQLPQWISCFGLCAFFLYSLLTCALYPSGAVISKVGCLYLKRCER